MKTRQVERGLYFFKSKNREIVIKNGTERESELKKSIIDGYR